MSKLHFFQRRCSLYFHCSRYGAPVGQLYNHKVHISSRKIEQNRTLEGDQSFCPREILAHAQLRIPLQ